MSKQAIAQLNELLFGKEDVPLEQMKSEIIRMQSELKRLREGDFTPIEFQNLCHNKKSCTLQEFCKGCEEYQTKIYGESLITQLRDIVKEAHPSYIWELSRQYHTAPPAKKSTYIERNYQDMCNRVNKVIGWTK